MYALDHHSAQADVRPPWRCVCLGPRPPLQAAIGWRRRPSVAQSCLVLLLTSSQPLRWVSDRCIHRRKTPFAMPHGHMTVRAASHLPCPGVHAGASQPAYDTCKAPSQRSFPLLLSSTTTCIQTKLTHLHSPSLQLGRDRVNWLNYIFCRKVRAFRSSAGAFDQILPANPAARPPPSYI